MNTALERTHAPLREIPAGSGPLPAPDGRIEVLHVISTLLPGGSEISVLRLASALDKRRFRVRVAWLMGPPALSDDFRAAGIEAIPIGMRGKLDPACLLRLRRLVKRERIDVVHTHMDVADFYGTLAGRLGGSRCIVTTKHAPDEFRTRRTWKRYPFLVMERLAYRMADAVIVVSDGLAEFLVTSEHLPRRKMVVIGHGVEDRPAGASAAAARRTLGLQSFDPLLGAVGRLSPEKGHLDLLRALPGILAQFPRAGCVVAGEGRSRPALEAEAARLGIADRVVFLGFRRDVPMVLAALDLFVQPSIYEGFGISLLEAMGAGVPVVASRVGGISELIEDGVTGALIPPQDPVALASAALRLLGDREGAQRISATAAMRVRQRHSLAAVAARVETLYMDFLGRVR